MPPLSYYSRIFGGLIGLIAGALLLVVSSVRAGGSSDLIKLACTSETESVCTTVYYLASDGRRYVFPNEQVYRSWYPDFATVTTVSEAEMAALSLGGVVTYKPGVRLLKIQSDPRVYAVGRGGLLHWIADETIASTLYGSGWARAVDDIPVSFFSHYTLSSPVVSLKDYDPNYVRNTIVTIDEDKGFAAPSGTNIPEPQPDIVPEPNALPFSELENDQLPALLDWATPRGISFVGVRYDFAYFQNQGTFNVASDGAPLADIPRTNWLYAGLQKIPSHLLPMLRGETIYLSTEVCSSAIGNYLGIFDPSYDESDLTRKVYVPEGLYSSWGNVYIEPFVIFMCQKYTDDWAIVHEMGHVVDFVGIRMHKGRELLLKDTDLEIRALYDEYERVFQVPAGLPDPAPGEVPPGFISIYATNNILENFADHFAYYRFQGPFFRERMATDPALAEKYNFLKTHIFLGVEYE